MVTFCCLSEFVRTKVAHIAFSVLTQNGLETLTIQSFPKLMAPWRGLRLPTHHRHSSGIFPGSTHTTFRPIFVVLCSRWHVFGFKPVMQRMEQEETVPREPELYADVLPEIV